MNAQDFINSIKDGAQRAFREYNVYASMTIAQAILETGYGASAPGNNLFGIKWQEGCGYDKQLLNTREVFNGQSTYIDDYFRKYDSMADSVYDHAMFLIENSRYKPVLNATSYTEACAQIQACGYATDPNYTTTLIQLIKQYSLYDYDIKEEKELIVTEQTGTKTIVSDTKINVRSYPSMEGGVVGELKAGDTIYYNAIVDNPNDGSRWVRFELNGVNAYVKDEFTQDVQPVPQESTNTVPVEKTIDQKINDVVYALSTRISMNTDLWKDIMKGNINVYYLAEKMLDYCESKNV